MAVRGSCRCHSERLADGAVRGSCTEGSKQCRGSAAALGELALADDVEEVPVLA